MKRTAFSLGLGFSLLALLSGCGNQAANTPPPSQSEVEALVEVLATLAPTYPVGANTGGVNPQNSMSTTRSIACPAGGTLTFNLTVSASETSLTLNGSLTGSCQVDQPDPAALDKVNLAFQGVFTFSASGNSTVIQGNFTETGGFTVQYKGKTYEVSDLNLKISTTDTLTFSGSSYTVSRSGSLQGTLKVNGRSYTVNQTFSGSVPVSFNR